MFSRNTHPSSKLSDPKRIGSGMVIVLLTLNLMKLMIENILVESANDRVDGAKPYSGIRNKGC